MNYFQVHRYACITITGILVLMASCTPATQKEDDIALIESIENSLLPSVLIEGHDDQGYHILDRMENYNVPGVSIAFLNSGEIVWAKGYGFTSLDSGRLVDEHTLFQAASISKPVAALAALSLVEEGKIDLDADVNQYLKGWQVEENAYTQQEKVTLRRLLSHSAGLTVHGFGGYSQKDELPEVVQILNGEAPANSGRIYPDTIPGSVYRYSGGGYTVMQKMLTDISGEEFPDLMQESVLSKLGMDNSTYQQPLPEEFQGNASSGHLTDGEEIAGQWHTYPEMAAAGLWTTPTDLLKYAREVQLSYEGKSNKVLSKEMVHEMLTPQMNSHGLGPGTGGEGDNITFGHGGSNAGFRCQLMAFTKQGQGVAVMTNGDMGGYLMDEILRSFSKLYGWDMYKPEIKSLWPLEKGELDAFAGKYLLNYYGQELVLELSSQEGHLTGLQLWDNLTFQIYPESANSFFNPEDGVVFVFKENKEGKPAMFVYQFGQEFSFQKL